MTDNSFVFVNVKPEDLSMNATTKMQVDPNPPKMKSMHVLSTVRNRYARTVVTSKYTNQDTRAQQATFSIVLPDTAFIAGFVMEIKGKKYEAYVKEKEEAKQIYQNAVSRGRAAAHVAVSARDSNNFTVSVNVEPQSDVTFILTYEELLVRKHSKYELLINLHPGHFLDDLRVDVHINETRPIINVETPALQSGNNITDKALKNKYATISKNTEGVVHVSFHPTVEEQKEIANTITNESRSNGISGQFIVEYDVERDPTGGEVLVNDGYFVHFFAPTDLKPIPKHVVFVLDVSGSMFGRKIEQLKEAMKVILSELNSVDYFNIIKFSNNVQILYNNSLQGLENTSLLATTENINTAQRVIGTMQAEGGTNICDALITALSLTLKGISDPAEKSIIQPIIVFLTDGQANVGDSNPRSILDKVEKRNEGENKSAIFTLAFGNDANKEFLKELAIKNSGFQRNIYEAADASLQLQEFYKQISSPLLTNVHFKYSEEVKETTKHNFDILFNGSEFVVTGKVDKMVEGFVIVEGSTLYGIDDFRPTIIPVCPTKEEKKQYGSLERLWAYMTIKQLLDKKYEKNDKNTPFLETPEKQALKLALKYSFVTPVTSLVVVKPEETAENDLQWGSVRVASSDSLYQPFSCLRNANSGGGISNMMYQQQQQSMGFSQSSCFGSSPVNVSTYQANNCKSLNFSQPASTFGFGSPSAQVPVLHQSKHNQSLSFGSPLATVPGPSFMFSAQSMQQNVPQNMQQYLYMPQQSMQQNMQQNVFGTSNLLGKNLFNLTSTHISNMIPYTPVLKSMHMVSSVRNRYARTVVTSKYVNQETRALQATFTIVLPDNAFIAGFVMETKGTKYDANIREKEIAKEQYQEAVIQGLAAAHITCSAENSNKFTMSINVEQQSEIIIMLIYEQLLNQNNGKYEVVSNLYPGQIIEDLQVVIQISDTRPIANVETPVFTSNNTVMKSQIATVNKNDDGSIHVSFKPTAEQQIEIIKSFKQFDESKGISGQFIVEYIIKNIGENEISMIDLPSTPPVTDLVVVRS